MDFSIIIPTYNRRNSLKNCLTALSQLDFPKDKFEVIVVDDGSEESMVSLVATYKKTLNIFCLRQANAGPATARNNGVTKAKGNYLVFTDDDCQIYANYLTILVKHIQQSPKAIFTGKTINLCKKSKYSEVSQLLTDFLYQFFTKKNQNTTFLVSNNFAIPRFIFQAMGGFDKRFVFAASEDREFGERLVYEGYQILYQPTLNILHNHCLDLRQFWKQHFTYGKGSFLYTQISQKYSSIKKNVSPISFYAQMCLYPFSKEFKLRNMQFSLLLILSQIAYILGHFSQKLNGQ